MQNGRRELTLLVAVTAVGGVALSRAVTPGNPDVASWRPMDSPPEVMALHHPCAHREAVLGSNAPARYEFEVQHPARFLGPRGGPQGISQVEGSRRPLVQFVVDARGYVVVSSLKVLTGRGDSTATMTAIQSAARHWRYSPAMVDGCPTSQIVQTIIER
jgi:hypothetical protein